MKKVLFILLFIISLFIFVSCNDKTQNPSEHSEPSALSETSDTQNSSTEVLDLTLSGGDTFSHDNFFYEVRKNEDGLFLTLLEPVENEKEDWTECFIPKEINSVPVLSIEDSAFWDCNNLKKIVVPEGLKSIGGCAFQWCHALEEFTIPNTVTEIGEQAFYDCQSLQSITIPNSITTIRRATFAYCQNLTEVNIPESVTLIEEQAFRSCESLETIRIPSSVEVIDKNAFGYLGDTPSLNEIIIDKEIDSIPGAPWGANESVTISWKG